LRKSASLPKGKKKRGVQPNKKEIPGTLTNENGGFKQRKLWVLWLTGSN
jgi:hypothetical protein